ncbi:MAG: nucleotidyl transferase AbiEii/AbiGii toxin family protein [Coriobacteriia bacterium]|nr:nucleotidyl transferase AbiEii/AbiGii toxin family protein [Coriobacteriia bacterium]
MVRGIVRFREHFADYTDRFVLVGGAAVDVLMDRAGLTFRATKDLDVVLLVESLDAEFGAVFWEFIKAGEYEHRHKSRGEACFYRFHTPKDESYPHMIELFARRKGVVEMPAEAVVAPLPVAEEVSSLSAILLDDIYYEFVRRGARVVEGVPLLGPEYLIPLKAHAWLDLTRRRDVGESIQGDDIKKHRADVVRLYQLISPTARVLLPAEIAADLADFLGRAYADGYDPAVVRVRDTNIEEVVLALRAVYGLDA